MSGLNRTVKGQGELPVAGADLYYDIEGNGPAVLLVHGFTLDARMWDDQVVALRDIATVVRCDLRGYGRSTEPAAGVPYTNSADLLALLDHLGIDTALLVGSSMGGRIVLETALVAPHRVRGLVLLDSVIGGVQWDPASMDGLAAAEKAATTEGVSAAVAVWLAHPFFAPARRDPELATRLASLVSLYSGFHWTHRDPEVLPDSLSHTVLEQVTAPTTVVVGALDVPCFLTMADVLEGRIRGARRVDIPDSGHMVNLEAPDTVNAMLREAIMETR
jgi:3-oxoadipate enol-lactonase